MNIIHARRFHTFRVEMFVNGSGTGRTIEGDRSGEHFLARINNIGTGPKEISVVELLTGPSTNCLFASNAPEPVFCAVDTGLVPDCVRRNSYSRAPI